LTKVRRLPGWEGKLPAYLKRAASTPFAWGSHDCALFAAGWVIEMTGIDFAAPYRGYKTARGAAGKLKRLAGGELAAAARQALGAPLPSPLLARRGDIAAVTVVTEDAGPETVLGVVDDSGMWVAVLSQVGLERLPLETATRAWAVG